LKSLNNVDCCGKVVIIVLIQLILVHFKNDS